MSTRTQLTRRQALLEGASFCSVGAFAAKTARYAHAFVTEEVAPGIHIRRGVDEDVTAQNEDFHSELPSMINWMFHTVPPVQTLRQHSCAEAGYLNTS